MSRSIVLDYDGTVTESDLLDRAFDGSAATLLMRALSAKKTSAKELADIRKLLKSKQGEKP